MGGPAGQPPRRAGTTASRRRNATHGAIGRSSPVPGGVGSAPPLGSRIEPSGAGLLPSARSPLRGPRDLRAPGWWNDRWAPLRLARSLDLASRAIEPAFGDTRRANA